MNYKKELTMIPSNYPRPFMYRKDWRSLNGAWEFDFYDDEFLIESEKKITEPLQYTINVPYTYQTKASGINDTGVHKKVIYRRKVQFLEKEKEKRIILHFAAADYRTDVWIDGEKAGYHEGGYAPFSFDITQFVTDKKEITISVIIEDSPSLEQPRGKQAVTDPFACWYTPVTGLWQSVWLEFLPYNHIENFSLDVNTQTTTALYRLFLSNVIEKSTIVAEVFFYGEKITEKSYTSKFPSTDIMLPINDAKLWSPEEPNLYEIRFSLYENGDIIDQIETYFAFRELEMKMSGLYINNKRYFQKLVLMQGFWKESGYTAPSDNAFEYDIKTAKEMGFNGGRMHIKAEDPRFYYAADRLGFLIWGEAPSFYKFTKNAISAFRKEWSDIVMRDALHPSIVVWVLGNESWGMRDIENSKEIQSWLNEVFDFTKKLDSTRPIIGNDGWEHLKRDLFTFHSYEHNPKKLEKDWMKARNNYLCGINKKPFNLNNDINTNIPWVLSEFGGITFIRKEDTDAHWGYEDALSSVDAFTERLKLIIEKASSLDSITGWCYTQFSDIEKEKNGLLFADRTSKIDAVNIKQLIDTACREVIK